jgi:hypothetical protein
MKVYLHLDFIIPRIKKLQTALFTDDSQCMLKFPISVISVAFIDDEGTIWFKINKRYSVDDHSNSFHCKLQFYNKGYNYFILAQGNASIHSNKVGLPDNVTIVPGQELMIKMHIINVECFFSIKKYKKDVFNTVNNFFQWLLQDGKHPLLKLQFN